MPGPIPADELRERRVGTAADLTGALLAARAGLDMVHVPYRRGAPATTDLLAGQVQMYFGNASELCPTPTTTRSG